MNKTIEIGTRIWAEDGKAGTLSGFVADPATREPKYLVIKRGIVRPRHIVVPVSLVKNSTEAAVVLGASIKTLDAYPDYVSTIHKGEFRKSVPIGSPRPYASYAPRSNQGYLVLQHRNVPESTVSVEKGMAVRDRSGQKVGSVSGLMIDAEGRQAVQILLRQQGPIAREKVVPTEQVADVRDSEVHLRISASQVDNLVRYLPEEA